MGMIPKEQVPPMLLVDNPAIDKTQMPQLGATVTGTAKTVTMDDIIAAEGARVPDSTTSQKQFNVGFVLLTRAGDSPGAAPAAIETLRNAWAGRFAESTQGAGGVANVPASIFVSIDSPVEGTTITGPDASVTGTVINSTGAETGVVVNGMPATVTGSRFVVNHVPLQTGSNAISVTATDANGLSNSTTGGVTVQAGNYIRLTTNIESGVAPLDISLRLSGSFIINNPMLLSFGPVAASITQGQSPYDLTTRLTVEGTYAITASAVGPDGQTYSDTVTITVFNRSKIETLLKGIWSGINNRIIQNDIDGALQYLRTDSRIYYRSLFAALGDQLVPLAQAAPPIEFVYADDERAKCRGF
jgi:hypothetical protein